MAEFKIDEDRIRKLAALLHETGLSEIELSDGDRRLRLTRFSAPPPSVVTVEAPVARAAAEPVPTAPPGPAQGSVLSPMVGTAYLAPEPGAPTFVKAGDRVSVGQTLLIIEAMKVMNPIRATRAGIVAEVLVQDAQPVEFGEPLMVLT